MRLMQEVSVATLVVKLSLLICIHGHVFNANTIFARSVVKKTEKFHMTTTMRAKPLTMAMSTDWRRSLLDKERLLMQVMQAVSNAAPAEQLSDLTCIHGLA